MRVCKIESFDFRDSNPEALPLILGDGPQAPEDETRIWPTIQRLPQCSALWHNEHSYCRAGRRCPAAQNAAPPGARLPEVPSGMDVNSSPSNPSNPPRLGQNASSRELRHAFVDFFAARGHRQVPSSSLVPVGDATVLLTTAGMQQMTPYFLGLETPPAQRMASVQKCFRTVDIDEVGDESHCTFFFMLGNFSVGDYFKRESLAWSWEFLTEVDGPRPGAPLPDGPPDDDEAYAIWRDEIGVPEERSRSRRTTLLETTTGGAGRPDRPERPRLRDLLRPGRGARRAGRRCAPGCDCARYLEVWNNVFMEFFKGAGRLAALRCPERTSTPAWASSGWRWSCRRSIDLRHRPLPADHPASGRAGQT